MAAGSMPTPNPCIRDAVSIYGTVLSLHVTVRSVAVARATQIFSTAPFADGWDV